ncbi:MULTISPECIES: hypothetical protein [Lysinibacillus]|uniref:hypothetical protein n=1 Tax=Lysinibacillus TaxID=400634 RepID=UPI0030F5C98A
MKKIWKATLFTLIFTGFGHFYLGFVKEGIIFFLIELLINILILLYYPLALLYLITRVVALFRVYKLHKRVMVK